MGTSVTCGLLGMMLSFDFNWYMVPLLLTAVIAVVLGLIAWQRRQVRGARTFIFVMSTVAIHAFCYAFELASVNFETAHLALRLEYIGISFLSLSYALHILTYIGKREKIPKVWLRLAFVVPTLTVLLVWTNDAHHLIWQAVSLDRSQGFTVWRSEFGLWFWIHIAHSYSLLFLSVLFLFRAVMQSPTTYRRHMVALFISVLAPFVGNIYLFLASPAIDPTAFMFGVSGMAMGWAMFRGHFLELVPVARETLLLQLRDGVIVLDRHNQILDVNPAAEHLLGVSINEAIGQQLMTFLPQAKRWDWSKQGHVNASDVEVMVAGTVRTYEVGITPLQGQRVNGRLISLHDITQQKETEQILRQARDAAQAADKAKTSFLANMSHELRTPLAVIMGYTDLIEDMVQDEDQVNNTIIVDRLGKIRASGEHLLVIINDVLDLAKLDSDPIQVEMETVMVEKLLEQVIMIAKPLMATNQNELVTDISPIGMIETDEIKLRQILMNLLRNAAKFTEGGTVTLMARRLPQSVQFIIRDTGIGMSEELITRLFQPFMQADVSTTRKYGGAGLGLIISQRLAHLLGGDIGVESELGQGSTFILTLPLPESENGATINLSVKQIHT